MLRISEYNNALHVNGEEIGTDAFEIIFKEALGLSEFAKVREEVSTHGVSTVDLRPGVRGVPLGERISRAEATRAIQIISNAHKTTGEAVEKLGEVMEVLTAPTLMMILQLIAAKENEEETTAEF